MFPIPSPPGLSLPPENDSCGIAVLVIVGATRKHQHWSAAKPARHHLGGMAADAASGEAGQVGIGYPDGVLDLVDEAAKAGAQHERR